MFVIMSKAKFYAMEALVDGAQKRCDALETQLARCEKRLKLCRETEEKLIFDNKEIHKEVVALQKRVSALSERWDNLEQEIEERAAAQAKAEKDFTDGVASILNYTGMKQEGGKQ